MAATGYTPIQLYRTTTAAAVPSAANLSAGELAININDADMALYAENASGTVKRLMNNPAGLKYPTADGSSGQFISTDGSGNLTFTSPAASLLGQTDSASPFETALGYQAGNVNTGVNNTFVGYQAGLGNTTGTDNVAIGYQALDVNTTGINNVAVGSGALGANIVGTGNIAIGKNALLLNTTSNIIAIGLNALDANTTGQNNVGVGTNVLGANTTGGSNTALGNNALLLNTTGQQGVAIGYQSLGSNVTGIQNTAVGHQSLYTNNGDYNTAVGNSALYENTTGSYNTAVGQESGDKITTGTQNVTLGYGAASSGTNDLTTGSNNIVIGYNAAASSATVSNEVTLGNTSIVSTRLRGMVELNAAMFEQATVSATAATGTINFDTRTQSVLYYTSNASANWTLNIRASSGVSLNTAMTTGQSLTIAFLVTNGATAYYQTALQVDGSSVTPKWQGGTAPTAGNASSIDAYVITIIKTASATFTALASQTKFA